MSKPTLQIWECKLGGMVKDLPDGADFPLRQAVEEAYRKLTGVSPQFNFSGWGSTLTESETAATESVDAMDATGEDRRMETKTATHTTGPWTVKSVTNLPYNDQHKIYPMYRVNHGYISEEETEANARLIAAAPEMLEALEYALERGCSCHSTDGNDWHADRCFVPKVRAAIQKALTGQNQSSVRGGQ